MITRLSLAPGAAVTVSTFARKRDRGGLDGERARGRGGVREGVPGRPNVEGVGSSASRAVIFGEL